MYRPHRTRKVTDFHLLYVYSHSGQGQLSIIMSMFTQSDLVERHITSGCIQAEVSSYLIFLSLTQSLCIVPWLLYPPIWGRAGLGQAIMLHKAATNRSCVYKSAFQMQHIALLFTTCTKHQIPYRRWRLDTARGAHCALSKVLPTWREKGSYTVPGREVGPSTTLRKGYFVGTWQGTLIRPDKAPQIRFTPQNVWPSRESFKLPVRSVYQGHASVNTFPDSSLTKVAKFVCSKQGVAQNLWYKLRQTLAPIFHLQYAMIYAHEQRRQRNCKSWPDTAQLLEVRGSQ